MKTPKNDKTGKIYAGGRLTFGELTEPVGTPRFEKGGLKWERGTKSCKGGNKREGHNPSGNKRRKRGVQESDSLTPDQRTS